MTTTHRLHDTGRHQRALSVHRRPPTVPNHLKSQSSGCTKLTRQPPQSTAVVTITNCGCSHPALWNRNSGYQAGHHEGRRNFMHCLPLLKEFLYEMDRRKDTTQNPPGKIHQGVPSFIHFSKAARCNSSWPVHNGDRRIGHALSKAMTRAQNKDPLRGAENVAHVADRRAHKEEHCFLPRRDSRPQGKKCSGVMNQW